MNATPPPERSGEAAAPIYRQIQAYLQELISGPDYAPGDRIPSERALAEQLGRNRITVRKAVEGLIAMGLLERNGTGGTRIPAPRFARPTDPFAAQGVRRVIQAAGGEPGMKLLHFAQAKASAKIAARLQIAEGADIVVSRQLWTSSQTPVCVETSHFPLSMVPDLAAQDMLTDEPFYALLQRRYGVRAMRAEREIGVSSCPELEARLLNLDAGAACLSLWMQRFDDQERPIEYMRSINHPKFVVFKTTLPDEPGGALI